MLTGDSDPARRRAVAARVTALADHCETTLLNVQTYCQAERLRYPPEVAAIPGMLRRFSVELQEGKRPHDPGRRWWRRW